MGWLAKFKGGLHKTAQAFCFKKEISLDDLETALIQADVGMTLTDEVLSRVRQKKLSDSQEIKQFVRSFLLEKIQPAQRELPLQEGLTIFLFIGVNGSGKTTTIAKMAHQFLEQKKQVVLAAADTFRAGAIAQLQEWAQKINCPIIGADGKADAASVAFESCQYALENKKDILLIDTAGRLHNKVDLMHELEKINRVIIKATGKSDHKTILVLDATVGQNALYQVEAFQSLMPIEGLIMTKLDGTAKGGILLPLTEKYHLPIFAVGLGEKKEDLVPFEASSYVDSLLEEWQA